jgi:moderate conductance mechanosensitive channel
MPTQSQLLNPNYYVPMLFGLLRIGLILLFAYICAKAVGRVLLKLRTYVVKVRLKHGGETEYELEKRVQTISGVTRKVLYVVIWCMAGIMILKELNFDVRPLLAGAGIIGVAIGFGAQSIVKDVLNGLFLLVENQLRVHDVATINGKTGLVEEINLRTTVLRAEDGAVHIFPNGSMTDISNLTREFSYFVLTVSVSYREDPDHVMAVLKEIGTEVMKDEPFRSAILEPLEVMGVDKLGQDSVVIKARFKTLPSQQWVVGREMNRRIKKRFEEAEIQMPFPAQNVQPAPEITPALRKELRQTVQEVLKDGQVKALPEGEAK